MKPIIAITIGDFNGIGPEISLRSAMHPSIKRICQPVLVGPLNVFEHIRSELKIKTKIGKAVIPMLNRSGVPVIDVGDGIWADVQYGSVTKAGGKSAGAAIEQAVFLAVRGDVSAVVTAPVSKKALNLAGYNFPGQTEMIAMLSRSNRFTMMLVSNEMRIGLITTHVPLASVANNLSIEKVCEKIRVVHDALMDNYRIKKPKLALLSLNPHGGEDGLLGPEERDIIQPALEKLREEGINVEGPFSADAFFGTHQHKNYDAVMAMYHDQGLIPLKLTSFEKGVNFSAGLNIIRTSPDHGTAYDIAGKGKANITSMIEAIKLAALFSKNQVKRSA